MFLLACLAAGCSKEKKAYPDRGVYVVQTDSGYHLLRNGSVFRVKGASTSEDTHWEALRKAGGNTVRLYDTIDLESRLNQAAEMGLAVAVDIPLPELNPNKNLYADEAWLSDTRQKIENLVRRHKDHPALLFWTLGNEVVPNIALRNKAMAQYNSLARIVKNTDPSHPLTTTVHFNRREILNASLNCPSLDFLSINIFGAAGQLEKRMGSIRLFWEGPYMITEWGINGPWEADIFTQWGAPIEQTSTKKAEHYLERYRILHEQNEGRLLGDFLFYWGKKEESTPTWYSAFLPNNHATQITVDASRIWSGNPIAYNGPRIEYLLLEGQGAPSSVILNPGKTVQASLLITPPIREDFTCFWEIRPEHWYRAGSHDRESRLEMPAVGTEFLPAGLGEVTFKTPLEPGPYRLYVYLTDSQGFGATTNIPFFILEPKYGL